MNQYAYMEKATKAVSEIYTLFLEEVVEKHLMAKDREAKPLSEKAVKKIKNGTHIDPRILRLMGISGKGGYSSDPEKQKRYSLNFNITLFDHLLSIIRGSLMFAALDWLSRNPDMEEAILKKRLAVIAVIGFMHDIDKDLQLERNEAISQDDISERMERYGIAKFLDNFDLSLSWDHLLCLIESAEASQAHRHWAESPLPREFENLPRYVRLADQLDSAWVLDDPESGGINGVMKCLEGYQGVQIHELVRNWKKLHLFDPLHPFLLDELQRNLSRCSIRLAGVPPLIEVHHDGHLFMLLPAYQYDAILQSGLTLLTDSLPFNLSLDISNRGVPCLYNGCPDIYELEQFIYYLEPKQLSGLFRIKQSLKEALEAPLDDLLSSIGLEPIWPNQSSGQLLTLYADFKSFTPEEMESLYQAACLVMLLNLKVDAKPKHGIPKDSQREKELLTLIGKTPPEWLSSIQDPLSRRTLTGLWVTVLACEDEETKDFVWNPGDGLLKEWLEGSEDRPGFSRFITGDGSQVIQGVKDRFNQMISGQRIIARDENAKGRCLFTDEPVEFSQTIKQATGLYGVKVSAFSGRDGRPESVLLDTAHTNVGASSLAEHKLRKQSYLLQGGREGGIPTLISSPVTSGLFGGLAFDNEKSMASMSIYDLSRIDIKKGRVMKGFETYRARYRIARLENIPEKLADQVHILRMVILACRRTGRPIHLFRGLPVLRKEFFYYDAMPRVLVNLIGGNALYLEQLPEAVHQLDMARELLNVNGLGYDVLRLYADPNNRFGAACMAWCHIRDNEERSPDLEKTLETEFIKYLKGEKSMGEKEGALVKLGTAAAGIQQNPGALASNSDEILVFKICLEAVSTAQKDGQKDTTSLVYAVAGELESNLVRREKMAKRSNRKGKPLMQGCEEVAGIFVNEVWKEVFKNRFPTQKTRRVMESIYRVAFLKAHRNIKIELDTTSKS